MVINQDTILTAIIIGIIMTTFFAIYAYTDTKNKKGKKLKK